MLVHRAMLLSPSIQNRSMFNSSNYGVITKSFNLSSYVAIKCFYDGSVMNCSCVVEILI